MSLTGGGRTWRIAFWGSALASVGLAVAVARSRPVLGARWALLILLGLWAVTWVAGTVCARHLPVRWAVLAIVGVGVAVRLAALDGTPLLSDDLYRYSWDARVQVSGTDPYRFPPAAAALRPLREPWLWPDARGCAHIQRPPGCTRINRPPVRTIYPPVAEAWFSAVYEVGGGVGARHKVWQVAGLVTEVATLGVIARLLRRRGRDPRWLALYALCPAPVVSIVGDGHVDGLAVLFLLAAFLAMGRSSEMTDRRAALAGALIGAGALVKIYPAVALIGVWVAPGLRLRHRVTATAAAAGLGVVAYAPHVATVGIRVIGYLPGYLREEHYTGPGGRYLLAGLAHLPAPGSTVLAAAAVVAALAVVARRRPPAEEATTVVIGVALLAASPVQPWYAVALLAMATIVARPAWAVTAAGGYPYFFAVILAARHQAAIGRIAYGAGALALVAAGRGRRRSPPVPGPAVELQIASGEGVEGEVARPLPP